MATITPENSLLNKVNVDTTGELLSLRRGGKYNTMVEADDMGGGTIILQLSMFGDSWQPIKDGAGNDITFTGPGVISMNLGEGQGIRAVFAGSTDASNVSCAIYLAQI